MIYLIFLIIFSDFIYGFHSQYLKILLKFSFSNSVTQNTFFMDCIQYLNPILLLNSLFSLYFYFHLKAFCEIKIASLNLLDFLKPLPLGCLFSILDKHSDLQIIETFNLKNEMLVESNQYCHVQLFFIQKALPVIMMHV